MKMWHFSYANVANTRNVANKINKNIPEFGAKAVQTGHHTYFWTRWYDKTFTHLHICQFQFLKNIAHQKKENLGKAKTEIPLQHTMTRTVNQSTNGKNNRSSRKKERPKERQRSIQRAWGRVTRRIVCCLLREEEEDEMKKDDGKKEGKNKFFFSWVDAIELLPKNAKESTWF